MPQTLTMVAPVIRHARARDTWHRLEEQTGSQRLEFGHCGLAQRWLVVQSQAAAWRAEVTLSTAQQSEQEAIAHHLFPWQAQRCETPLLAHEAWAAVGKQWTDHQGASSPLLEHQR